MGKVTIGNSGNNIVAKVVQTVAAPIIQTQVIEKPIEVLKTVEVERIVNNEVIVEKMVSVDKIVEVIKTIEVEKIVEVPVEIIKEVIVEKLVLDRELLEIEVDRLDSMLEEADSKLKVSILKSQAEIAIVKEEANKQLAQLKKQMNISLAIVALIAIVAIVL